MRSVLVAIVHGIYWNTTVIFAGFHTGVDNLCNYFEAGAVVTPPNVYSARENKLLVSQYSTNPEGNW